MNRFFLSIVALACVACATTTPSWATDKKTVYCQGRNAISMAIQKGDLTAKGMYRQLPPADSPPFSEVDASDDLANNDLPVQWTHLSEIPGPIQLLCLSDTRMTQVGDAIPLPAGTKSCSIDKNTKGETVISCISMQ